MKVAFAQTRQNTSDSRMAYPNPLSSKPESTFSTSYAFIFRGLCEPHKGQRLVNPGVVLMGYPGDSVLDRPDSIQRPRFTKNGTFMVFRKLEQDVCGFEKYVEDNRGRDSSALFAAKMVGRFKSV